jgi:hypothetical protein
MYAELMFFFFVYNVTQNSTTWHTYAERFHHIQVFVRYVRIRAGRMC